MPHHRSAAGLCRTSPLPGFNRKILSFQSELEATIRFGPRGQSLRHLGQFDGPLLGESPQRNLLQLPQLEVEGVEVVGGRGERNRAIDHRRVARGRSQLAGLRK